MIGASVGMYCIITTPGGQKVKLWQKSGYEGDPYLKDLPVISSMEITLFMKMATEVSVSLDMTYEQGVAFLNSPLCWPRNSIEAWIGYPDIGVYSPRVYGQVLKPDVSISPEGATITLVVRGTEYEMFRRRSTQSWKAASPDDIVTEIVERYGKKVEFTDEALANLMEPFNVSQKQKTDWEFIKRLIESFGCTMHFGTNSKAEPTLFVMTQAEMLRKTPKKKFIMRGNFDVQKQQYPLLGFSSPTDWTWLAATSKSVVSMDIQMDDKKDVKNEATQDKSTVPNSGIWMLAGKVMDAIEDVAGTIPKFLEDTAGKFIPMTSRDPTVQGRLQERNDKAARDAGIQAECQTLGVADLIPGEMVELVVTHGGEGALLDGNYGVTEVKHSAGGDGWETNFTTFKGGFGKNVKMKGANESKVVANQPAKGGESGVEKRAGPL